MAIKNFTGVYLLTKEILDGWQSTEKGVYYLGVPAGNGGLHPYYIGKGTGEYGMRGRLYDHIGKWRDVTHFTYQGGDWDSEIDAHELERIKFHRPKYNIAGL